MSVSGMHSTMKRCGWILGSITALVLSAPFTFASGESGPSNPNMAAGPTSKLATTCYFGEPSESCAFTCTQKSMDAYCDDKLKQCLCRDPTNKEGSNDELTDLDETTKKTNVAEEDSQVADHPKTNFRLSDFCIFGHPSPPCVMHCNGLSLKAYCDEDERLCVCETPPEEGLNMDWVGLLQNVMEISSEGSTNPQDVMGQLTGSSSGINGGLFSLWQQLQDEFLNDAEDNDEETTDNIPSDGDDNHQLFVYVIDADSLANKTEALPTSNTTKFSATHPAIQHVGRAIEGWAVSHVLAIVLIVFLFGLVLLEMAFCFKKKDPNNQMETIFPTKK